MASVFLSYDHDDAAKARPIAIALEKAGHSVWWDLHIRAGDQYTRAIDDALCSADAVVVLWSKQSVESAWVRDEAAAGRDNGRLVPVLIEPVQPPLGFRQFQNIDLAGWRGRGKAPRLGELLLAITALTGLSGPERGQQPAKPTPISEMALADWSWGRLKPWLAIGAIIILLALLLARPWEERRSTPVVTVVPSDNSAESQAIAKNLLVQLGSFQAANSDALNLADAGSDAEADLVFKIGAIGQTQPASAQLSLIEHRSGTLLWSREFVQPNGNEGDLRQQIAYSAGQVLQCATDALAPTHRKLKLPTLKLYLNGCADISDLLAQEPRIVLPTFKKVTEQSPSFAGGWAKLLLAEMFAFRQTNLEDATLRQDLRRHIDLVRKLHPTLAEPPLAEAWLQDPRPISGWMKFADEAVAKDPNHAEALMNHATGLLHVGRVREAVDDVKRAVQAQPLYPAARSDLVETLAYSGATIEARNALGEIERLWPGASGLLYHRFWFEYRYGDPKEAMRILQSGVNGISPTKSKLSFLDALINPSPARIEKALADARHEYQLDPSSLSPFIQILVGLGRTDEAVSTLLAADPSIAPGAITAFFRPNFAELRSDPRFMAIAKKFELLPYWQQTGKWPDFCFEPGLPYNCQAEAAKLSSAK